MGNGARRRSHHNDERAVEIDEILPEIKGEKFAKASFKILLPYHFTLADRYHLKYLAISKLKHHLAPASKR